MQLGIPSPPRPVALWQVPGAVRRVSLVVLVAAAVVALASWAGGAAGRALSSERDFFARAIEVQGRVGTVTLPPVTQREGATGTLSVVYSLFGKQHSASGLEVDAIEGEELGRGNEVALLVDPENVEHPREARLALRRAGVLGFGQAGLTLGLVLGFLGVAFELRRALRRELEPLRSGMLVWLTPPGLLPATRFELVFPASYFKDDVKYEVRARARPGRAPVRNGEKLLAAVLPSEPGWVRVIDEDLAKALGWFR